MNENVWKKEKQNILNWYNIRKFRVAKRKEKNPSQVMTIDNYTHRTWIPVALSGLFSFFSDVNVVSFFFGGIGGAESNRLCRMGGSDFISVWIKLNVLPLSGSDLSKSWFWLW